MARYLGLDWDNNQLYVVSAATARGGVRVERAIVLDADFSIPPDPATRMHRAEALGRLLRDRLKEAGIAPAPAVACVGRDRVIVKEVRFPPVPAAEEPALVRFQATKELTEPPEALVLDYTVKGLSGVGLERTAFAFAVRREVPGFLLMICRAAGLKLLALAPRGVGVAACLDRALGMATTSARGDSTAPEPSVAVLTRGPGWTDFSVVRGGSLVFTRALPANGNLAAEVRRNLAVYAGQSQTNGRDRVQALYVSGGDEQTALREQLHQTLSIPVHALDPFSKEPQLAVEGGRGSFAGAVGLAERWAGSRTLPVNFLKPKEPVEAADPEKKRMLRVALIAAVLLGLGIFAGTRVLADRAETLSNLQAEERDLEEQLRALGPDAKHIQGLNDWTAGTISWLDEIYELTAKFPWRQGFKITELRAVPRTQAGQRKDVKAPVKDKYVARVTLTGEARSSDERFVEALKDALNDSGHRATMTVTTPKGAGGAKKDILVFKVEVDMVQRPTKSFTAQFTPPVQQKGGKGFTKTAPPDPPKGSATDADKKEADKKDADKKGADPKGAEKLEAPKSGVEKKSDDKKGPAMAPEDEDLEGGQR